ncbi:MAG: CBS domain-containing protein [Planctomycetota bacterium]
MTLLRDLLTDQQSLVTIEPRTTVREAAKKMAQADVGSLAIMDGDRLAGIFTERDLLRRVLVAEKDLDATLVSEVMTKDVITCQPGTGVNSAILLLRRHKVRHLPVVSEDGKVVGMFSIRDLLREEMQELRDYIARAEG